MSDDEYVPAERPPGDIPGGDRVRFESEGGVEQSMFGGSADDIARSIMEDTSVNINIIGRKITSVRTNKDALGSGGLQEVILELDESVRLRFAWTPQGLVMAVKP